MNTRSGQADSGRPPECRGGERHGPHTPVRGDMVIGSNVIEMGMLLATHLAATEVESLLTFAGLHMLAATG